MSFNGLLVTEIFHSIQGESTQAGLPFVFVRLTGCNLRCHYCDTAYAFHGGTKMTLEAILKEVKRFECSRVLITGGEPLMQRNTPYLARALRFEGLEVSVETHGEFSIEEISQEARIVMDIKTPGSGMCREGFRRNYPHLKPSDEVKFVLASPKDYEWAKGVMSEPDFPKCHVLFSAAKQGADLPGEFPGLLTRDLANQMIRDNLEGVRIQTQLHKEIWGPNQRGV